MSVSSPPPAAQHGVAEAEWTVRGLIARHKLLAAGVGGLVLIMVALTVAVMLGPRTGTIRDSTKCTQWSSSNRSQQQAYAQRYLSQHGALPNGATGVSTVAAAVDTGCLTAFSNDEEDNVTVLDAITKNY